ncbi:Zn cluster transcription factor [Cordyceps militaris]|uniref:Zn cluster transcription factor n=1 Tax=Cordyceps militaris TaxID=73501 RepID=A0A2H4SHC2_CORMI|nr:Zn cluster transcription factor [Cordyceps militaris]
MTDRKSLDVGPNGKDKSKPKPSVAIKEGTPKDQNGNGAQKTSPKKRRKVNHACVYCRRSHMTCDLERPCTRCIKRNIGHLCHDQPRESDIKKPKSSKQDSIDESEAASTTSTMGPPPAFDGRQRSDSGFGGVLGQGSSGLGMVPNLDLQPSAINPTGNMNQFAGFSDAWLTAQNFNGMNQYNPNYMVGDNVNEFKLLNDFLNSNLLDEPGIAPDDTQTTTPTFVRSQSELAASFNAAQSGSPNITTSMPPPPPAGAASASTPGRPRSSRIAAAADKDKEREYYLQAADPAGNAIGEERMSRVLMAKYDAGLLKPFNYINGYARLGKYLDGHIAASSKQKILRTIHHFRPKFREKAQGLTDLQLLYVEMWFERQLMDYDRVFASMAVPACCWRRTGEIFRGNKEMAELINVPVDQLRDVSFFLLASLDVEVDERLLVTAQLASLAGGVIGLQLADKRMQGKIALHEILTEESMVRYWEEFGTIAFDPSHDTLLTACSLKNPSDSSDHPIIKCCFSFTIRRDEHKLPALIVGNFLPHDPPTPE